MYPCVGWKILQLPAEYRFKMSSGKEHGLNQVPMVSLEAKLPLLISTPIISGGGRPNTSKNEPLRGWKSLECDRVSWSQGSY